MLPHIIDTHCHLHFSEFDSCRDKIISEMRKERVSCLLACTDIDDYVHKILPLSEKYNNIFATIGIHPYRLDSIQNADYIQLMQQYLNKDNHRKIKAIGEVGLDKRVNISKDIQNKHFCLQLDLANTNKLPVIIHGVRSHDDILRLIKSVGFQYGGIFHAFTGSYALAKQYYELGFKLGINAIYMRDASVKIRSNLMQIPLAWLVLETDAPFFSLERHLLNTPMDIIKIAQFLANYKSLSYEIVINTCNQNAIDMLKI